MLEGVDVSYAQGNYHPGSEAFVIVNASRANIGLAVGSQYRNQVANARAAGKHVGHYFFNGNVDATACANFFVNNLTYQPGDSLWLDVESEASTNTAAWTPGQALAFINQVRARMGVTPGVYLNRSLMDGMNWSAVVKTGAPLWIAYYNAAPPPISWWPTWTLWQYTSNPIDRNRAQGTSISALGSVSLEDDLPDMNEFLNYPAWDGGPTISQFFLNMGNAHRDVQRAGVNIPQIQDNADTNTMVRQLVARPAGGAAAAIDYDALAAAIVAKLPTTTLTQQDVTDALRSLVLKAS